MKLDSLQQTASAEPASTSSSSARSQERSQSDARGRRRTNVAPYAKDTPAAQARRNGYRRLMEQLVGGRAAVARLSPSQRARVRAHAIRLYEDGLTVGTIAEKYADAVGTDGFIYVVTNPAFPGYVKIGCAINVCSRLADYQTYCPFRSFKLEHAVYVSDRRKAEALVHMMFHAQRGMGEWFQITVDEAVDALESVREFDPRAFDPFEEERFG